MAMQGCSGARGRGFTLVELLLVLGLVAILLTGAAGGFAGQLARHRASSAGGELVAALAQARTMALLRGRAATVCPSTNNSTCGDNTAWQRGWIVFLDRDRNGQRDGNDDLLAATVPRLPGIAITASSGRRRVQFLPDGRAAGSTITFHVCSDVAETADLRVIVSNVGRVRRADGATCPR